MNNTGFRAPKFNICDLLIVLLVMTVLFSNYIWLKIDEHPIDGHGLSGLTPAVQVYRELKGLGNTYKLYDHILGNYNVPLTPPLSYLIVVLFYFLFGLQGQMVVMVNSLYIAITLWSVYLIGKNISNRQTGLLAAFILSSFSGFIAFSRVYWIEFGLMAYVTLDIYLLLKSNFFENRKYSILLGISLALSFLHKYEFIPFVIGPLLLVVYKSGILQDISKKKWTQKATNLILTFILASGLTSFWWARYGNYILKRILSVGLNSEGQKYGVSLYETLFFYLRSIILLTGIFFLALFLLSVIFLIVRTFIYKKGLFYAWLFIISFIVPYIIFTLSKTKNTSHILSILPWMAILISVCIYFIKNKVFQTVLIILIFAYGLNIHIHSFIAKLNSPSRLVKIFDDLFFQTSKFRPTINQVYIDNEMCPPRKERFEFIIREILEYIKIDSDKNKISHPRLISVYKNRALLNATFEYYSLINNYQFIFMAWDAKGLSDFDYIIIEKNDLEVLTDVFGRAKEFYLDIKNFKSIFKNGLEDFDVAKEYSIPNGASSVFIYKRKPVFSNRV